MLFTKNDLWQHLVVSDIKYKDHFLKMTRHNICAVYSDPPWNPGNEKYWRTHAGKSKEKNYDYFLDRWCEFVVACNPKDIFIEQSVIKKHREIFDAAVARCAKWELPLLEEWIVYYGSPGGRNCSHPNKLLHFGVKKITTNPSNLKGIEMTRTVFNGLDYPYGSVIADPCIGKGMTSRLCDEMGWNCVGTEINPKRLQYAINWLIKNGYK